MKLWILQPQEGLPNKSHGNPWVPWYDKMFGIVVRADSEVAARQLAANCTVAEAPESWLEERYSSCSELSQDGEASVILRDLDVAYA